MPTFSTPEPITATIDLAAGDVRVLASDRSDTVVEVRPSTSSHEPDVKAAEQTRVEYTAAGLLIKIIKDPDLRSRIVTQEAEKLFRETFRRREQLAERQQHDLEEHALILEFEETRERIAELIFNDLAETKKSRLRKEKSDQLRQQERFQRLTAAAQHAEVDAAICQDIARSELPPYEKWRLRKQAQQAVLPFVEAEAQPQSA